MPRDASGRFVSGGGGGSISRRHASVRLEMDWPACVKFLKTDEGIRHDLDMRSIAVAERAEQLSDREPLAQFQSEVVVGEDRQRAAVWTDNYYARIAEAYHHVLVTALDAAR